MVPSPVQRVPLSRGAPSAQSRTDFMRLLKQGKLFLDRAGSKADPIEPCTPTQDVSVRQPLPSSDGASASGQGAARIPSGLWQLAQMESTGPNAKRARLEVETAAFSTAQQWHQVPTTTGACSGFFGPAASPVPHAAVQPIAPAPLVCPALPVASPCSLPAAVSASIPPPQSVAVPPSGSAVLFDDVRTLLMFWDVFHAELAKVQSKDLRPMLSQIVRSMFDNVDLISDLVHGVLETQDVEPIYGAFAQHGGAHLESGPRDRIMFLLHRALSIVRSGGRLKPTPPPEIPVVEIGLVHFLSGVGAGVLGTRKALTMLQERSAGLIDFRCTCAMAMEHAVIPFKSMEDWFRTFPVATLACASLFDPRVDSMRMFLGGADVVLVLATFEFEHMGPVAAAHSKLGAPGMNPLHNRGNGCFWEFLNMLHELKKSGESSADVIWLLEHGTIHHPASDEQMHEFFGYGVETNAKVYGCAERRRVWRSSVPFTADALQQHNRQPFAFAREPCYDGARWTPKDSLKNMGLPPPLASTWPLLVKG